jgi:hypothetical protein
MNKSTKIPILNKLFIILVTITIILSFYVIINKNKTNYEYKDYNIEKNIQLRDTLIKNQPSIGIPDKNFKYEEKIEKNYLISTIISFMFKLSIIIIVFGSFLFMIYYYLNKLKKLIISFINTKILLRRYLGITKLGDLKNVTF